MKKVGCLLLFCTGMTLALVAMANGGEKIRCRAEPSRGEWHYRIVDEKRCWFRGYRKNMNHRNYIGRRSKSSSPDQIDS